MLEVTNLSVAYGGLRALTDVSLSVSEGQFVTVVGPNGAGKSTLFKTISGVVRPSGGTITFQGENLLAMSAAERAHRGIAHVPEGRQVFKTLTVLENLEMGAYPKAGRVQLEPHARPDPHVVPDPGGTLASKWPALCRAASSRWSPLAAASPARRNC